MENLNDDTEERPNLGTLEWYKSLGRFDYPSLPEKIYESVVDDIINKIYNRFQSGEEIGVHRISKRFRIDVAISHRVLHKLNDTGRLDVKTVDVPNFLSNKLKFSKRQVPYLI